MKKAFVSRTNKVSFTCPRCKKTRTVDVTRCQNLEKAVNIKVHCPCGHDYPVMLERRQQYRKPVSLPGTFTRIFNHRRGGIGTMVVKDVSRRGLQLTVDNPAQLDVGNIIAVEFKLDDNKQSPILKEVVIRTIDGCDLGTEFTSIDPGNASDKAIGFYLM